MGAGHTHALYVHEHSPTHRLAAEAKIVATLGMVIAVAVTPRRAVWAFGVYALLIGALVLTSRVPLRFLLTRLVAVAPFVLFALFIPFIAAGETVDVIGVALSVEGLWGAWNVIAKAVLGASVSILLTATTEVTDIIRGLGVIRVPVVFTSIATFMIRYLELVSDELGRMRVAMTARAYDPKWLAQARPIATSAGVLFVRSFERGERAHAAMVSRGYTGVMPDLGRTRANATDWVRVALVVVPFVSIAATALVVT
ncbi:MAG: cobalt ECF transporter T component CbiQ [Acidimicrobiia bacterium]|jgi:cobalt/nickel transport system permease protein